jgi:hypothetical protein
MRELTNDEMMSLRGGVGPIREPAFNEMIFPRGVDGFLDQLLAEIPANASDRPAIRPYRVET